ncbi:hypothetical protein [Catellatospora sp. NPDC049133]|uniref:hypothetical protein n=1 Tax=Catellatospora sp. NPDC049133 TaxID=3155499 RepID=UPI0033FEA29E
MYQGLTALVAMWQPVEAGWRARRRQELDTEAALQTANAELAQMRADNNVQFKVLREAGRLRGSIAAVILPALRDNMAARGWFDQEWPELPSGVRGRRGRPWGAADRQFTALLAVDLPDDIGERLLRACHHTSAPAVADVMSWHDTHGDHWRGVAHTGKLDRFGKPSSLSIQRRNDARANIIQAAEVLREAGYAALDVTPPDVTDTDVSAAAEQIFARLGLTIRPDVLAQALAFSPDLHAQAVAYGWDDNIVVERLEDAVSLLLTGRIWPHHCKYHPHVADAVAALSAAQDRW